MKGIGSTAENLKEAVAGETHEFEHMYPEMIEAAKAEDAKEALRSFEYANTVEKVHADLYQKLLDNLGGAVGDFPYYVCPVCGYTAEGEAPERCPVCNAKGSRFMKID